MPHRFSEAFKCLPKSSTEHAYHRYIADLYIFGTNATSDLEG